jgi:hypothetical protein
METNFLFPRGVSSVDGMAQFGENNLHSAIGAR